MITARRNLTPDQRQILIGRRYNREKLLHGGDRKSSDQFEHLKTSEKLADEYKVAPIAGALLDAEVRIGQLFKALPKASGGDRKSGEIKSNTGVTFDQPTKQATIANLGFDKMQASRFETLAEHPERFLVAVFLFTFLKINNSKAYNGEGKHNQK